MAVSSEKQLNGYDFASYILNHPQGGVEALLHLSGNGESSWLELKAGMCLLPEDEKRGEKPDDLYWNIAKAIIEIANTAGGILFIGIDDKSHKAVPLESNDPEKIIEKNGLEDYRRRKILAKIWPENKKWIARKDRWTIEDDIPADLVSVIGWKYQNENIAAILIKPVSPCIHVWKNEEVEQILARHTGEIGQKLEIIGSKRMQGYEEKRESNEDEYFTLMYQRFLHEVSEHSEVAAGLDEKISAYYDRFDEKLKKQRLFELSSFVHLDASGDIVEAEDDFMAPQATEIDVFESDDWLDDDDDTDDDDIDDEDGSEAEDDDVEEDDARIYEHRTGNLINLMREIPRMIVLGEPGGGKTTTLTKFTMLFRQDGVLAVFIPMGQWSKGGGLIALIENITGLNSAQWLQLIQQQKLRLVIDAVNECPDQLRQAAILNIENFLQQYPDVPVVISTRTDADLKRFPYPFFSVLKMDEQHQLDYLNKYLNDDAMAQDVFTRLKNISGGGEIATNPMLLRLVVEVFKEHHELPVGRADLYHQWLNQWYKREYNKTKQAGERLPWNFSKALDILADLAFQSRLQGYRDIPHDIAENILEKYGYDCIEKLCQGPVITIDEGFIRFRHETFQEYLCAEKLVQQPDLLVLDRDRMKDNAIQWGMPLAYAVELCWPLPEPLWRAAWAVDPWFGAAVTDKQRMFALFFAENNYLSDLQSKGIIPNFTDLTSDPFARLIYIVLTLDFGYDCSSLLNQTSLWYKRCQYFSYLVSVNKEIAHKFAIFELWQLANVTSIKKFCQIIERALTLKIKNNFISKTLSYERIQIDKILNVEESISDIDCEQLLKDQIGIFYSDMDRRNIDFVKRRVFIRKDFSKRFTRLIAHISPEDAKRLIDAGLATRGDFVGKIPQWIKNATIVEAQILVSAGLATKDDFADKIPQWIKYATFKYTKKLVAAGLATRDDFADKISQWIKNATIVEAQILVSAGLATKDDFADKIQQWIDNATQKQVQILVSTGLATKDDFADKIPQWIKYATPGRVKTLVSLGFATLEDFADKISQWIKNATLKEAKRLVAVGLATNDDFADKIPQWIKNALHKSAKKLIEAGFATTADFEKTVENKQDEDNSATAAVESIYSVEGDSEDMETKKMISAKNATINKQGTTQVQFHIDKNILSQISAALQQMCSYADKGDSAFSKKCPQNFGLTCAFVRKYFEELKQIIALLQSLGSVTKITPQKYQKKINELAKLLNSRAEYAEIANALVLSTLPDNIKKKSDEQVMAKVQPLPKTEDQAVTFPMKTVRKKNGCVVLQGINYNPEVSNKKEYEALTEEPNFSLDASCIRIYIDETWPGTQDDEYCDIGVISGIVWCGNEIDETVLPWIPTHLRTGGIRAFKTALKNLLSCEKAFPFIFPIHKRNVTQKDYMELLRISILTLLGWVLPQNGKTCKVKIFCEGISGFELLANKNLADRFSELLEGTKLTQNRCARWQITEFKSMSTRNKDFEYIPYADLIGYTVVPTTKASEYRAGVLDSPQDLLGYVPLSLNLLQDLCALDTNSAAGYADALLSFAKERYRTKFFKYIIRDTVYKAKQNKEFKDMLFDKLERMFEEKDRDMKLLNSVSKTLINEFPLSEFDNYPQQKLNRILVELQAANHNGEPEKVDECVKMYMESREKLKKQNLELCVYTDMNLAVHFNDRFEFESGAMTCRKWENEGAFNFLSPENQGRILSSIGQSYSFTKNYQKADEYYKRALDIFTDPENHLADQADQTQVYRALNILDYGNYDMALKMAEMTFQCSFADAIKKYATSTDKSFHHHLLVKNLYLNPELKSLQKEYLQLAAKWKTQEQHPWELIELYRILMLKENEAQVKRFKILNKLYENMETGTTLQLLQAFAWSVYNSVCGGEIDHDKIKTMLADIKHNLPACTCYCDKIENILSGEITGKDIWKILPFNYQ